jgi:hypothetical protein
MAEHNDLLQVQYEPNSMLSNIIKAADDEGSEGRA